MASGGNSTAVISAANLLMVAMLKLNRVLVPAFLRVLRSSRARWVRRSSREIASEIVNGTHVRKLCVGSCCGGAMASVHTHLGGGQAMAAWSHANAGTTDPLAKPTGKEGEDKGKKEVESDSEPESGKSFVSDEKSPLIPKEMKSDQGSSSAADATSALASATPAVGTPKSVTFNSGEPAEVASRQSDALQKGSSSAMVPAKAPVRKKETPLTGSSGVNRLHIPGFSVETDPLDLPAEELYFRMRVMEEERHRASSMNPAVFTAVMNVYFTLFTMFLYAFIIISIVLSKFHFSTSEAVLFSFSLIGTATISEAETLLQPQKKKKSKKKKEKKAAAHEKHGKSGHGKHGKKDPTKKANAQENKHQGIESDDSDDDTDSD